jgi:hypothetical protein
VILLKDLADVCRQLGTRYSDANASYSAKTVTISRHLGGREEHRTLLISASGGEVQAALAGLADLADAARRTGVEILADL